MKINEQNYSLFIRNANLASLSIFYLALLDMRQKHGGRDRRVHYDHGTTLTWAATLSLPSPSVFMWSSLSIFITSPRWTLSVNSQHISYFSGSWKAFTIRITDIFDYILFLNRCDYLIKTMNILFKHCIGHEFPSLCILSFFCDLELF